MLNITWAASGNEEMVYSKVLCGGARCCNIGVPDTPSSYTCPKVASFMKRRMDILISDPASMKFHVENLR